MKLPKSLRIRTKLISGFLVVAFIVALVGVIGYGATNKMYKIQKIQNTLLK